LPASTDRQIIIMVSLVQMPIERSSCKREVRVGQPVGHPNGPVAQWMSPLDGVPQALKGLEERQSTKL
jgi:hypothetical protein